MAPFKTTNEMIIAEHFQLRFGSERVLAPEVVFDPNLLGSRKAGVGEAIKMFLLRHDEKIREMLVQNIFLCGGFSKQRLMEQRVEFEIRQLLPTNSKIRILREQDYLLDAWKGAWNYSKTDRFVNESLKRSVFMECGFDYLFEKERRMSLYVV
jgi:actin-related protein 5